MGITAQALNSWERAHPHKRYLGTIDARHRVIWSTTCYDVWLRKQQAQASTQDESHLMWVLRQGVTGIDSDVKKNRLEIYELISRGYSIEDVAAITGFPVAAIEAVYKDYHAYYGITDTKKALPGGNQEEQHQH